MSMKLRAAKASDTSEIAAMLSEMLGGPDSQVQAGSEAARIVCGKSWDTLLAEAEGRSVGFASSKLDPMEGFDSVAEIVFLYIRPELRRSGIGTSFLQEMEGRLSMRGIRKVFAKVNVENVSAVQFWIGKGYQFEARISGATQDYQVYLLGKRLVAGPSADQT